MPPVTKRMTYRGIQNRWERVSHVKWGNETFLRVGMRFVEHRDALMQILACLDRDKNSSVSVALVLLLQWEESEKRLMVGLCFVTKITNWACEWEETYSWILFYFFILITNWTCQWKRQTDSTGASETSACDKEASLKKKREFFFASPP